MYPLSCVQHLTFCLSVGGWVGVCAVQSIKGGEKKKLVSFQIEMQEVRFFFFLKMIEFKSELWNALG